MMKLIAILFAFLVVIQGQTLVDLVVQTEALSTLETIVTSPGFEVVVETLSGPGPFTVFAPINAAFDNLGMDNSTTKPRYPDSVLEIVLYHAVSGEIPAAAVMTGKGSVVPTLLGEDKTLRAVRYEAPFVPGVIINGSPVVLADVNAENGVAHAIGTRVLNPNQYSVLGTAARNYRSFSILYIAVLRAGRDVGNILRNRDGITVFAPTNTAFLRLSRFLRSQGTSLLRVLFNRSLLSEILAYHVVDQVVYSGALVEEQRYSGVPTLNGQTIDVERVGNKVNVIDANGRTAEVVIADINARNGVIHAIDEVILPASTKKRIAEFAKRNQVPEGEETLDEIFNFE